MRAILENIKWFFGGLAVVLAFDEDPELWDNPRKRERIRRRWKKGEGS
jgi:hypothetical protein